VIRVLIVARSSLLQKGLEAMLVNETSLQVAGQVGDLATLEAFCRPQPPDVVLIQCALLTDADRELLTALAEEMAIALLVAPTDTYSTVMLLQSGIRAILPMDVTADELILTIEAIATGLMVLHPDVSTALLQEFSRSSVLEDGLNDLNAPLTPREVEVLQLLATGLGNRAIAHQLKISEHTVKFHISSIFSKLNASSRTEAVTLGMRLGLIFI